MINEYLVKKICICIYIFFVQAIIYYYYYGNHIAINSLLKN